MLTIIFFIFVFTGLPVMTIAAEPIKPIPTQPTGAPVEVVYPRDANTDGAFPLRAGIESTFLLGNVGKPLQTKLTINGIPVAIDSGGGWLAWLKCPSKNNDFVWHLQAVTESQTFNLDVPVTRIRNVPPTLIQNFPEPFWAITTEGARFRKSPQGKNILLPMTGTPVRIHAQIDAAYGAHLPDGTTVWMDTGKVSPVKLPPKLTTVKSIRVQFDRENRESKVSLVNGVATPFRVDWNGDSTRMRIELMRFKAFKDPAIQFDSNAVVSSIRVTSHGQGCWYDFHFKPESWIIGYTVSSNKEGVHIIFREAPLKPKTETHPLNGWKIVVDPGHGGSEYGAIGPTWLSEKSVNLTVATRLTTLLRERGAEVHQTRVIDTLVKLPDRVAAAEEWGADLLLSVHQNAVPDDENPWDSTGSAVYYYHPQSEALSQSIYSSLHRILALPERGVYVGDFAICRSQKQLAVLTESTFIIRPDQERQLHDPAFIQKQAKAIVEGIVSYVYRHPNRNQSE